LSGPETVLSIVGASDDASEGQTPARIAAVRRMMERLMSGATFLFSRPQEEG
jgi:hypothetical protein